MLFRSMNDIIKYPNGSFLNIEQYLMQLASYAESLKDDLDDETYVKISDKTKSIQVNKNKDVHWKSGTGYGHDNAPKWDITAYIKSQEEKDKQIAHILEQILNQPDCVGINIYKGLNELGKKTYVLVGMDRENQPILNYSAIEISGEISTKEGIVADRNFGLGWFETTYK